MATPRKAAPVGAAKKSVLPRTPRSKKAITESERALENSKEKAATPRSFKGRRLSSAVPLPPKRRPAKAPARSPVPDSAPTARPKRRATTAKTAKVHEKPSPDLPGQDLGDLRTLWGEMRAELDRMKVCQIAELRRETETWKQRAYTHAKAETVLTANEAKLRVRITELEKDCLDFLEVAEDAKRDRDVLLAENEALRGRLRQYELADAPKPAPTPVPKPIPVAPPPIARPTTYAEIPAWVKSRFADKLILLPRAVRSLANALYDDVEMVCKVLELLADEYRRMRMGQFSKPEFQRSLNRLRLRCSRSISPSRAGEEKGEYFVKYPQGTNQRRFIDSHLRNLTMTRLPEKCLAVYFFWDSKEKLVVVAWLPSHLNIRST